jgi:IPT/TIG domain-containing protein/putative pyrroloquinoline-quinone binding quinoprotein
MFFQCKWESVAKLHRLVFNVLFLIALPLQAAVISEISPSAAPQGTTISVVITGSGFVSGATRLRVSGTGIGVSSIKIPSSDTIIATLVLSAPPGTRNISVEGPDGNSNAIPFVVQPTRRTSATNFEITHLAGGPGGPGVNDGVGTNARFYAPTGLWGVGGVLYVAEIGSISQSAFIDGSRRLRKVVAATGEVSTVATLDRCPISSSGTFFTNVSLWADDTHAYIGDRCLHSIYKVDLQNGQISPLAQLRSPNMLWGDDADVYVLDNSLYRVNKQTGATQAVFSEFTGIIDGDGTFLYRVTQDTATRQDIFQTIRIATGEVTTVGTYALGQFRGASSVRRRSEGSGDFLYFIGGDSTIKRINVSTGDLTIFAGGIGSTNTVGPTLEFWKDGPGNLAEFVHPAASWADDDYLYLVEPNNHTLRRIRFATAEVSTLAGLPELCCFLDGPAAVTRLTAQDGWGDGNSLYVTDGRSNVIRRVRITDGETSTLAGNPSSPIFASIDGVGAGARFNQPLGIWGDGENLYVTERTGRVIRKIVIATSEVTTLAGKANTSGIQDGVGPAARFAFPGAIWGDGTFLYVSDSGMLRTVNIATGEVRTTPLSSEVGAAAFWGDGVNLYAVEQTNKTVKKIVIASGVVTTIAQGFSRPYGIWGDGTVLYVADADETVRAVRLDTGAVTAVAGTSGVAGSDDGAIGTGHFLAPLGIWSDGTERRRHPHPQRRCKKSDGTRGPHRDCPRRCAWFENVARGRRRCGQQSG